MMAVLDAIDDGGELALHSTVHAGAEDLGDLVGSQAPQAELAAAFEQLVDREVALEDEIDAVGVLPCHAALPRQDMVFLAHPLLGPLDR